MQNTRSFRAESVVAQDKSSLFCFLVNTTHPSSQKQLEVQLIVCLFISTGHLEYLGVYNTHAMVDDQQ